MNIHSPAINTDTACFAANLMTDIVAKDCAGRVVWSVSGNHGLADVDVIGGCDDGPRIYLTGIERVVSVMPWTGIGFGFWTAES